MNSARNQYPDPERCTFAELLNWHLREGTRPAGSKVARGIPWDKQEFISKFVNSGGTYDSDARKVRHWLNGAHEPKDLRPIIEVLFDDTDADRRFLTDFYHVWNKPRRRTLPSNAAKVDITLPPHVPKRNPYFRGRNEEIAALHEHLSSANNPRAAVLCGMGGVGKTSLAAEYVHLYGGHYEEVRWFHAETRSSLLTALGALRRKLDPEAEDEADALAEANLALELLSARPHSWLLVYDNAPSADMIEDLLPVGTARVLITSRLPFWSRVADEIPLVGLPEDEAVDVLESVAEQSDRPGAIVLARVLGQLPLALDHAGAYCWRTKLSFSEYAHAVAELIKIRPKGSEYPDNVYATFKLAIEATKECPGAQFVMALLCCGASERIPLSLIYHEHLDKAQLASAVLVLAELSLLKHEPLSDGVPAVTVHRLIQAVAREHWSGLKIMSDAARHFVGWLARVYPDDAGTERSAWRACEELTPHVLALRASKTARSVSGWPDLLNRTATYLLSRGESAEALTLAQEAVADAKALWGEHNKSTAMLMHQAALIHHQMKNGDAARELYEQALAILLSSPAALAEMAAVAGQLGRLKMELGDLVGAEPLLRQAAAARAEGGLQHDRHSLAAEHNWACLLFKKGESKRAIDLLIETIESSRKILGPHDVDTSSTAESIAMFFKSVGDQNSAMRYKEEQLAGLRNNYGIGDVQTVHCVLQLGEWYYLAENFDALFQLAKHTVEHLDVAAVNRSGNALKIYSDLALYLSKGAADAEVERMCLLAEAELEKHVSEAYDEESVLDCVMSIGLAYLYIGDRGKGEAILKRFGLVVH